MSAGNGEGDHHAVADLEIFGLGADFDDFTHRLMTDDVAFFH
jgi:hypothetical protein